MSNKSWSLTIAMYVFAAALALTDVYLGAEISEGLYNFVMMLVASTTAAGTFAGVAKNKEAMTILVKDIKARLDKPQ